MNVLDGLLSVRSDLEGPVLQTVVLYLLVGFIVGQFNAWCYKWTHRGVSYSRTFTQSLVLITMVSTLMMMIVAMNVLAAFGLLGGLAMIRYRTVVRDARDTAYILLCLICGMAIGFGVFHLAVIGSLVANAVSIYLYQTGFGGSWSLESLLRFNVEAEGLDTPELDSILRRHCRRASLVAMDEEPAGGSDGGTRYQCAYKIRLRRPGAGADLVSELRRLTSIAAVHLLVEQEFEEVV